MWLQATYEKLLTEVPKYKMITPSVLSDRLRVSGLPVLTPAVRGVQLHSRLIVWKW